MTQKFLSSITLANGSVTALTFEEVAGGGTVTTLSVVTANGFAGTVANATTTPALTLTTTVTGLIKGNGTALSAAIADTDYTTPTGLAAYAQPLDTALTALAAGSDFVTFSGPGSTVKTFTLPNASATILTSNTAVTVAQGGTGLATLTAHSLYVGNGTSAPTALAVGATRTVLHGNTGADPSFATVSLTADVSDILPTANGGTGIAFFTAAGPSTARVYTFPDAACTVLTTNAAVTVAQGGTGLATLTAHSLYVGNGTSAPTALGSATNGQLPIGSTGADPVLAALTGTVNQITVTNAAGSITLSIPSSPVLPGTTRSDAHYGTITTDADGATITFDMSVSNLHQVTLGANRTLAVANDNNGQGFIIMLIQDGTGSRTVTWWSGIAWQGGSAPTLTTTAGKRDLFSFMRLSSGSYLGMQALNF